MTKPSKECKVPSFSKERHKLLNEIKAFRFPYLQDACCNMRQPGFVVK